ncbi:protein phosphatase 2C domain-containing protein [Gallaecimonas kandeliae]|uniref:PP2C family protein-serine/threonine phosphatase n=1 Tax=Gallaecimonas kandeliae TaxID=3029055 RepID=UPI00264985EA|nr:protein phosphatase 2C domain-containing protein [Gallaecimonas kandeliae]WKE65743.1 protein phosphatase 2C domain-containing protein [Gallaecimonas kandeliae]
MRINSTGFTHRGGTRDHNEDAFLEFRELNVWVVADGMGGYQAGDVASQLICDTVDSEIRQLEKGKLTPLKITDALKKANQKIRLYGKQFLDDQTVGSTVVSLMINEGEFHLFWVGDSRCYLLRDGQLRQLSRDHSQVADMVEEGVITEDQAESHPLAHVITRAVGVDEDLEVDSLSGPLQEGDVFLLCSDGISKEFKTLELESFIREGKLDEASMAIMHAALVKKSKDNITCILVKVENDCYPVSALNQNDDVTVPVFR